MDERQEAMEARPPLSVSMVNFIWVQRLEVLIHEVRQLTCGRGGGGTDGQERDKRGSVGAR